MPFSCALNLFVILTILHCALYSVYAEGALLSGPAVSDDSYSMQSPKCEWNGTSSSSAVSARLPTHYLFVLQWPYSVCTDAALRSPCIPNYPRGDFKIHGLWPKDSYGSDPTSNSPEPTYKPIDASILPDMETYWPNLLGPNEEFWTRQWNKHGVLTPWTQTKYFGTVTSGFRGLNLLGRLDLAGLRPGPLPTPLTTVESRIHNALNGHRAQVLCTTNRGTGRSQITEIRVNATYDDTRNVFTFQDYTTGHSLCQTDVYLE